MSRLCCDAAMFSTVIMTPELASALLEETPFDGREQKENYKNLAPFRIISYCVH